MERPPPMPGGELFCRDICQAMADSVHFFQFTLSICQQRTLAAVQQRWHVGSPLKPIFFYSAHCWTRRRASIAWIIIFVLFCWGVRSLQSQQRVVRAENQIKQYWRCSCRNSVAQSVESIQVAHSGVMRVTSSISKSNGSPKRRRQAYNARSLHAALQSHTGPGEVRCRSFS